MAPIGPWNPAMIEKIKRQFGDDPQRWRREMEAEWAEDEDTWLAQSLIVSALAPKRIAERICKSSTPKLIIKASFSRDSILRRHEISAFSLLLNG